MEPRIFAGLTIRPCVSKTVFRVVASIYETAMTSANSGMMADG